MGHDTAIAEKAPLAILLAASSLTLLAGALASPGLPSMRQEFADTANVDVLLMLVLTVPGLAIALAAPLAGLAADKVGRVPVLLTGLVLYALAGASAMVLPSLPAIVAGRAALGVGIACTMTAATALITDYWDGPQRQAAMGLQSAAVGVGGVCYPLMAGVLAELGWRTPFLVYFAALALAVPALAVLRDVPKAAPRREVAGSQGFPVGLAALVFLLGFLAMVILYVIPLRTPFYLADLGFPSPTLAALAVSLPSIASVVSAVNFGRLRQRLSPEVIVAVSFAAMGTGYAIVAMVPGMAGLYGGLIVFGAGFGLNGPNLMSWLQARVPADQRGRAAGGYTTCVFFGQFFSTLVYAGLAGVTGYAGTFAAMAALCFAIALAGLVATAPFLCSLPAGALPGAATRPRE